MSARTFPSVCRRLLLCAACAVCSAAGAADGALPKNLALAVCDDGAEWPPFTFYQRIDGQKSKKITGSAVEVLERILGRAGIAFTIDLIPWKRCQLEIMHGGRYQMALNASYSAERDRDFRLSRAYYRLTSQYFYSRPLHPTGWPIRELADLKQHRVCGLRGYNYSTYGLGEADLDLSDGGFAPMIAKLHLGRCDLFVEKREIMQGFGVVDAEMARLLADPRLGAANLPGVTETGFHMIVSRAIPYSQALVGVLDAGIDELEASGELQKVMTKY